ncbi:hypothetical protein FQA47_023553 [Oryzias melastigma]|uniref:Uncharacterized protein n=1 Tax=Oryzias melastigma TaxID=30732 RepID=A0A834L0U7_ORYME|nr:hypothetical protein FQA47_023553 [Oryzias melastigma]
MTKRKTSTGPSMTSQVWAFTTSSGRGKKMILFASPVVSVRAAVSVIFFHCKNISVQTEIKMEQKSSISTDVSSGSKLLMSISNAVQLSSPSMLPLGQSRRVSQDGHVETLVVEMTRHGL